jgi:hypothetical protein
MSAGQVSRTLGPTFPEFKVVQGAAMSEPARLEIVQPPLSPEQYALVAQTIENLFENGVSDPDGALTLVQQDLDSLDPKSAAASVMQVVLESTGRFFQAFIKLTRETSFGEARDLMQEAADGFNTAGFEKQRVICIGIGTYAAACFETKNLNLARAAELMGQVKGYLDQAGKFGAVFQPMVDSFEPEHLYLAALPYMLQLNFDAAAPLIERASDAAEKFAAKYCKEGENAYFLYRGMARYFRAHYQLVKSSNDFNQLNYAALTSQKDLDSDAIQAEAFLSKTDPENEVCRILRYSSLTILNLQGALISVAGLMQKVFGDTFKSGAPALQDAKNKAQAAAQAAPKTGQNAEVMVRMCNQALNTISNLERYAKPTKKDFGVLSGVLSCALFLPLFLLVSWANRAFQVGMGGESVIIPCVGLSLIGGFGYGAVRFRSLFPWSSGSKSKGE